MGKLNSFIAGLLLFISVFAVAELGILFHNLNETAKELTNITQEIKQLVGETHTYTSSQIKNLESQQKSINASIQAVAVFNGTGRLINTSVIPRINKTLDSLNSSVVSLDAMVKHTDSSINEDLIPQLTDTAKAFNINALELNSAIKEISAQTSLTIQETRAIISSDEWKEVLKNISSTTSHVDAIAGNVEETTDRMPEIAALVEKMMKTTSKYQKALILSQIFSFIARAF